MLQQERKDFQELLDMAMQLSEERRVLVKNAAEVLLCQQMMEQGEKRALVREQ